MAGEARDQVRRRYRLMGGMVDIMSPDLTPRGEVDHTSSVGTFTDAMQWYEWGAHDARKGNRFNPPCYQAAAMAMCGCIEEADAEYRRGWLEEHERMAQQRAEVVPLSAPIRERARGKK